MDPERIWREWTPRAILAVSNLCLREAWRDRMHQAHLAGFKVPREPEWDLDGSRARYYRDEFELIKRLREQEKGGRD